MFERYTETARQAVFFARYEASQWESDSIETEHLLLGILRADGPLALRLLKAPGKIESIREQIAKPAAPGKSLPTSVDIPLSPASKRALSHAAKESARLHQEHIAAGHLLLGLLHEKKCMAAKVMAENGLTFSQLEQEAIRSSPAPPAKPAESSPASGARSVSEGFRDLTEAARHDALGPLIGRERELERMIQILSRRTRNNPVLVGESGVGKNAIVQGLAQRIASGGVPRALAELRIVAIDASGLLAAGGKLPAIAHSGHAAVYVHGLFDLAGKGSGWGVAAAIHALEPWLAQGGLQCIATGTPSGFRLSLERAGELARHFEVVGVPPPSEAEAIQIVSGAKRQYEKFHGVVFTDEAIAAAVAASRWFLRHRHLPDRAFDLIDDAGARVKLRGTGEPREIAEVQKRIRLLVRQMENAIVNHDFAKARAYSDEERKERLTVQRLREERKQDLPTNIVTAEDIVETAAGRAGVPVAAVKGVMQAKTVEPLELTAKELAAKIPAAGREWIESLAAYLAGCSAEEVEALAQAIRAAKATLGESGG